MMSSDMNVRDDFTSKGVQNDEHSKNMMSISGVALTALVIIGIIAAAGSFPSGPTIGWVSIGLGAGTLVFDCLAGCGKSKEAKLHRAYHLINLVLLTAALITVGALNVTGTLNTAQVGWGIIGSVGSAILVEGLLQDYKRRRFAKLHQINQG